MSDLPAPLVPPEVGLTEPMRRVLGVVRSGVRGPAHGIAEYAGIGEGSITFCLRALAIRGLIERRPGTDGRKWDYVPSERGR